MSEQWATVRGYEGLYEVSSIGLVRRVDGLDPSGRHRAGRILRQCMNRDGYPCVSLSRVKHKTLTVHRLVASAFVDGQSPTTVVNHRDGVKSNNAAENLEWVSQRQNEDHAFATGLKATGERHWAAKLTWESVRTIRRQLAHRTENNRALAKRYGVSPNVIGNVLHGHTWRES